MTFLKIGLVVLTLGLASSFAFAASTDEALSKTQKKAVENVVRELLLKKEPDLVIKAAQEMQRRTEKEDSAKAQTAITKNKKEIFHDPLSPVAGNKKGDVTIVEFFDYTCGYCKVVQKNTKELLKKDGKLRIVFKEYPILGTTSMNASKAALASVKQGKYLAFHEALMDAKGRLTEKNISRTAEDIGLDIDKLKKDMESKEVKDALEANRKLGKKIGARGTPSFVIGDKLYPGALPVDQMKELIAKEREALKK